ncbi:SETdomain-containing protein [Cordyceps javanica]|uniref:SETdomain-containing protein n=1 Tax=Cordyceps javanica TaxID=43265 RepID=A0A545W2Q0_9HYPO|nr:SETdomain-containing protein [Cordyceps javanica]TQW08206.1 SET domain-containing protein [Cordyceps javanica]
MAAERARGLLDDGSTTTTTRAADRSDEGMLCRATQQHQHGDVVAPGPVRHVAGLDPASATATAAAAAAAALPTPPITPVRPPSLPASPAATTATAVAVKAFAVRPSLTGGLGAFATRALPRGAVLLEETPLFVAARRGAIFAAFARLSRKRQRKAMALHASDHFKPGTPWLEAVWDTNSFSTGVDREAGLFPIAARFNHACAPGDNVHFAYDAGRRRLRLWVGAEDGVAEGEELKICYGRTKTPALLYHCYGFRCACGVCDGLSEQEMDTFSIRW